MEVIGAGWGRTGTLSLKTALDILDMPCYHMVDLMKHEDHSLLWLKLAEGEEVDYDVLLSGYKAVVDWPACSFYKQLMEQYPSAKVILTVRDPAKWYQSAKETIHKVNQVMLKAPWYVRHFPLPKPGGPHHRKMINTVIWENDLQGCFEADPEKAQQLFQQHIEEVKQFVPADRLLVFQVTDGWEPLCKFLGKPVPDQPFPHVNDAATWKSMIAKIEAINQMLTYAIPAGAAAIISAVAAAVMARRSRA